MKEKQEFLDHLANLLVDGVKGDVKVVVVLPRKAGITYLQKKMAELIS